MKNTWKLLPLSLLVFLATTAPAPADPPQCQVLCATTHCTSNADCPGSHCDFACPGEGCCVE
jgi:hypothetical protein